MRLRLSIRQHQQIHDCLQNMLREMRDAIINFDNLKLVQDVSSALKVVCAICYCFGKVQEPLVNRYLPANV